MKLPQWNVLTADQALREATTWLCEQRPLGLEARVVEVEGGADVCWDVGGDIGVAVVTVQQTLTSSLVVTVSFRSVERRGPAAARAHAALHKLAADAACILATSVCGQRMEAGNAD